LRIETEPSAEIVARPEARDEYAKAGFAWPVDPQRVHSGYSWLKLTAQDMLKLGELVLRKGRYDGLQVVSEHWIAASTGVGGAGSRPESVVDTGGAAGSTAYGYQWWLASVDQHPAVAAFGYGGQLIAVVPELDLVVAISSRTDGSLPAADAPDYLTGLVALVIVPALTP
jgi:CubicO group peptidase (beta-lactamase class C family)